MTQSKRIILNVFATWGRSFFSLVVGLFSARWILQSLGVVDFGLYHVIAGLMVFVEFINGLLKASTSRFYAFSEGRAQASSNTESGLLECRKWFTMAFIVHTCIPLLLVAVGYPVGIYAVRHWLTIPVDRLEPCVWVFRFACVSCFIGMANVPFSAMYIAKQYIAELTIYSFIQTTAQFLFVYYMVGHPGDWLWGFACGMCMVSIIPQLLIAARAARVFPECRLCSLTAIRSDEFGRFFSFAFWQAFGNMGYIFKTQGMQILVNKYFGPSANAAMSVANRLAAQSVSLTISLRGAFSPAITTAYGSDNFCLMRSLAFRSCKFGMLLSSLLIIPLAPQVSYIMELWLGNVPDGASELCVYMLIMLFIDQSTMGHAMAVSARGKIAAYQFVVGLMSMISVPLAGTLVFLGVDVNAVGWALVFTAIADTIGRVIFGRFLVGLNVQYWFVKIVTPIVLVDIISGVLGYGVIYLMPCSLLRLISVFALCDSAILLLSWNLLLDAEERQYVFSKVTAISQRFLRG